MITIYDCEIIKAIPDKKTKPAKGIEYCEGWHDFKNMGISCICSASFERRNNLINGFPRFRVFCADNMDAFQALCSQSDAIVGFNNKAFDDKLVEANGIILPADRSVDILVSIWESVGLEPEFKFPSHIGYGLDDVCKATFSASKSGSGALAPMLWQKGQYGQVIDYCMNDVILTLRLFCYMMERRRFINPKTKLPVQAKLSDDFRLFQSYWGD